MVDNGSTHQPADATPPDDGLKNQTSRISLDSARPLKSTLEAKKATGPVPGIPTHVGPIPQTIRLKRPPTSPITVRPADLPPPTKKAGDTAFVQVPPTVRTVTAETVKRQTSRIGLAESAAPKGPTDFKRTTGPILGIPMHAGPIPQTIRLKRPPMSPVIRPPTSAMIRPPTAPVQPAEPVVTPPMAQAGTEAPTLVKHMAASKTPTSRIVLEELAAPVSTVTAKQATAQIPPLTTAEPPAPKTIRLKRPASLSDAEETAQAMAVEKTLQTAQKGETAKIDLPLEDSSLTPITQRKTIKIKRTDRTVTPRSPTPEQPSEAAVAPEPGALMEAPAPDEEEQGLVFPLVAAAATLCIAALVYVMVAQAFGVHLPLPSSMALH